MAVNPDDLPLATHTRVLGVDITECQRANWYEAHEGRYRGGLAGTKIRAVGSDKPYIDGRDRRYIAAWARRTLFRNGSQAGDGE